MKSIKASIDKIIDELIKSTNDCFYQLLCAFSMYKLGQPNVDQLNNSAKVFVGVGLNLQVEPIPVKEIRRFRSGYPSFLNEIVILSTDGTQITYKAGDSKSLTIPELFLFKQSMLSVCQKWRTQ